MRRYGVEWPKFGLYWADGAVETEIETEETTPAPQSFSVDDIILEERDKEQEESKEVEVEVEGKTEVTTDKSEVAELKKQLQEMQSDLLKVSLNKREPEKTIEQKKEKLTKGQLAQIMKEHKDDPEVLLNVVEYLAEQKAEETRDATMKDVNHRQWHSNLSGMANRVLQEDEDGYLAANPKVKLGIDEYASNLGLGDHPVGKLAAYAIYRLSESVKGSGAAKVDEKSKAAEMKVDSNKGRLDKTRLSTNAGKSAGLSQDQLNIAKRFGVKPETYAKFVGGKR
jgi:hypothetical protein